MRFYTSLLQAAADPQMLQEMAKMAQMSPKDRDQLQHIQEGLSGAKPLDAKWIDVTVQALKSNPDVFKSMVKGKGAMLGTYVVCYITGTNTCSHLL